MVNFAHVSEHIYVLRLKWAHFVISFSRESKLDGLFPGKTVGCLTRFFFLLNFWACVCSTDLDMDSENYFLRKR